MKKALSVLFAILSLSAFAQVKSYAPTLVAPADNAVKQNPCVILDWNPIANANYYKLQLDTNAGFSNPISIICTYSAYQTIDLLFGQDYYWRVKAFDNTGDSSAYSIARTFETIAFITLDEPADSIKEYPVLFNLSKDSLVGNFTYQYQTDTTINFNSSVLRSDLFYSNKFETYRNLYGATYFWRVRIIHSNDTSDWSAINTLFTKDTLELVYPASGTLDVNPVDSIVFTSILGSTSYKIAYDTDSLFPAPKIQYADSSSFFYYGSPKDTLAHTFTDTLMFGTKYFWKALLIDENDSTNWSNIFNFTTIDEVTLISPADNAIDVVVNTAFTWSAIKGASFYILEYDTLASFSTATLVNATTNSYTPTTPLKSQTDYFWRVRAANSIDTTSIYNHNTFKTYFGLSVDEFNHIKWDMYPNPAHDYLNIVIEGQGNSYAEVINILGDVVITTNNLINGNNTINISKLDPGVYMVRLYDNDNITTKRLIKK